MKNKIKKGTKKIEVANKLKVLGALQKGQGVTRKSAEKKFDVKNLRATISDLRNNDGFTNIKTNIVKAKGEKFVKYTWN